MLELRTAKAIVRSQQRS